MKKIWLTNLTVLLSSIFFSLIFIEVYLHIAKPRFLQTNLSILGDFTDFTSRKYLDEKAFNKERGIFRILGLGDSFAEDSRWINKNYHDFLQDMFDMKYGMGKVEIINAGMGCTGPGYYLHILQRYGDSLKPNLVLVGFFVGNDFMEMNFNRISIGPYIYEPRGVKRRISDYLRFKNFWLFQFLRGKYIEICESRKIEKELANGITKERGNSSKETFLRVERDRMMIFDKHKKYYLENLWNQNSKIMSDIKDWCDRRKVALVIAVFPDQFQVERDLRQEIFEKYNLQGDAIDLYYPNKLLLDFCKQTDIRCVDLLEKFQKQAKFKKLYLVRDTHWNEEGNKLAAEIIFDYIEMSSLIKTNVYEWYHTTD